MGWNELREGKRISALEWISGWFFSCIMFTHITRIVQMKLCGVSDYGMQVPGFVAKGNVFGAQFHPEKSGEIGMQMIKKFSRGGRSMEIFPAIDLKEGRCVRLYKGEFSKETVMNEDPVAQAIIFEKLGAEILHIVDLDGAIAGESLNLPVIEKICKAVRILCKWEEEFVHL